MLQALALEAADDLADEAALDGVGLADDEGAIHGRRLGAADLRARHRRQRPRDSHGSVRWPGTARAGADDVERAGDQDRRRRAVATRARASHGVADVGDRRRVDARARAAAAATSAAARRRGRRARCTTTTSRTRRRAERLEHAPPGRAPASMPTTRIRRPATSKSSARVLGTRLGARRVVGAVDDDQRARGRPPRTGPAPSTVAKPSRDHVVGERRGRRTPRPRPARWRRCRPGGAPWSGTNTLARSTSLGVRRSTQPAADREPGWPRTSKSTSRSQHLARALGPEDRRRSSGSVSPSTSVDARLDDARLLARRCRRAPVPGERRCGRSPMLVTTATVRVDDVGGVAPAEQADLDDRHVDGDVGEPAERGGGHDLEVRRASTPASTSSVGDVADRLGQLVVGDRLAVAARSAR